MAARAANNPGARRLSPRSTQSHGSRPARSDASSIRFEVTAAAFRTARVSPILGRGLVDSDDVPGAAPVVVIGYEVWQRAFAGRSDVIGSIVTLGGAAATGGRRHARRVRVPRQPAPPGHHCNMRGVLRRARGRSPLAVVGRLAPGVSTRSRRTPSFGRWGNEPLHPSPADARRPAAPRDQTRAGIRACGDRAVRSLVNGPVLPRHPLSPA